MAKKTKASVAPLTDEERKAAAWKHYEMMRDTTPPHPTDNRKLKVGDRVLVGNLQDCVVEEVSPCGRHVLIRYTRVDNNYGNPITTRDCFGGFAWHDLLPDIDTMNVPIMSTNAHLRPVFGNTAVDSILNRVYGPGLVVNPDYQREYVWSQQDKERLIRSVLANANIGAFVFVKYPYSKYQGRQEVLDGKQRLLALSEFYESRWPVDGLYYHTMHPRDRYAFDSVMVSYAEVDGERLSRADLLRLFLMLNTGGVPQTSDHLAYVEQLLASELQQ